MKLIWISAIYPKLGFLSNSQRLCKYLLFLNGVRGEQVYLQGKVALVTSGGNQCMGPR